MDPAQLLVLALLALGLLMARSILAVLGAYVHVHTARHDLVRESKQKRLDYMTEMARRQGWEDAPPEDATAEGDAGWPQEQGDAAAPDAEPMRAAA